MSHVFWVEVAGLSIWERHRKFAAWNTGLPKDSYKGS